MKVADAKFAEVTAQADQYIRSAHGTLEGTKSALKVAEERHAEHREVDDVEAGAHDAEVVQDDRGIIRIGPYPHLRK